MLSLRRAYVLTHYDMNDPLNEKKYTFSGKNLYLSVGEIV
jgi:hypothetical protein